MRNFGIKLDANKNVVIKDAVGKEGLTFGKHLQKSPGYDYTILMI